MVTLKTLPQATEQEVFDQVKDHLLKQGKRSLRVSQYNGVQCLYRGPDGLKCAAGCLIADSEYRPTFEGLGWKTLSITEGVENHAELINALQSIHDTIEPEHWAENLKAFANNWKLKYE